MLLWSIEVHLIIAANLEQINKKGRGMSRGSSFSTVGSLRADVQSSGLRPLCIN